MFISQCLTRCGDPRGAGKAGSDMTKVVRVNLHAADRAEFAPCCLCWQRRRAHPARSDDDRSAPIDPKYRIEI